MGFPDEKQDGQEKKHIVQAAEYHQPKEEHRQGESKGCCSTGWKTEERQPEEEQFHGTFHAVQIGPVGKILEGRQCDHKPEKPGTDRRECQPLSVEMTCAESREQSPGDAQNQKVAYRS